jgi:TusA-related sulfurtransferase
MEEKKEGKKGKPNASRIDAVGLFCPIPIVKLKQALDKLASGEVAEVQADDPAFPEDVAAWCKETGNRLLSLNQGEEKTFIARVEKS